MEDTTIGAIFDSLSERASLGRTLALMGERVCALNTLRQTQSDYLEFQEALREFPGRLSLEQTLKMTIDGLQTESLLEARDIRHGSKAPRQRKSANPRKSSET